MSGPNLFKQRGAAQVHFTASQISAAGKEQALIRINTVKKNSPHTQKARRSQIPTTTNNRERLEVLPTVLTHTASHLET